jgi:hypothetical protein
MADHVPGELHIAELGDLGERFLDTVLPNVCNSRSSDGTGGLRPESLRDSDQRHFIRGAAAPLTGCDDQPSDPFYVGGDCFGVHTDRISMYTRWLKFAPRSILVPMIVSVLTRKSRISEQAVWAAALEIAMPRILGVLEAQPGFVSVQYLWGVNELGLTAQITRWQSEEDCARYVRQGGAAMVATIEEAAIPTAPYPDGAWVRNTFASTDV